MFEAGSIIWRIQTVGKNVLKQDLNESEQAAKKAGTALDKTGKNTEDLGKKSQTAAQKTRDLSDAQQTVGRTLVVVGAAMAAIGVAVAKTGIEYNTLQQTSRAALTTLLGSAEAANAQMDKLDEFARTSPFAKDVFIKAQQQMLAFGIESKKVVPYLDAIQNAVAAAGGSNEDLAAITAAMSKIQSSAKITAEDLNVFGNSGVNAAELIGSQMGMTGAQIREEITAGSLDAEKALDALATAMATEFAGASANVKETFAGATDAMKAAWRDFSGELMTPLVDPEGGGALIGLLNWTADMMRAFMDLPGPVKNTTIVLGVVAGAVALVGGTALLAIPKIAAYRAALATMGKTAQTVSRIVKISAGTIGVAFAVAAAALAIFTAGQADAKARTKEFMDTLDEETGAVTKASRDLVIANLATKNSFLWMESDSAFDAAEKLGLGFDLITDASMGNVDALEKVKLATEGASLSSREAIKIREKLGLTEAEYLTAVKAVRDGVKGQSSSIEEAIRVTKQKASVTDDAADADESAADAADNAGDAYATEAEKVEVLYDKLHTLIDTINDSNAVAGDAVSSNANYQAALEDSTAEVDAFIAANDASVDALDSNTAAGSSNMEMLFELAEKGQTAAEKQLYLDETTMGAKEATEKYQQALKDGHQAVLDRAIALGANDTQLEFIRDHLAEIPSEKQIEILLDDLQANTRMENWIAKWDGTSTVGVRVHPFAMGVNQADGGKVNFYADGGRENHIAQFARAGTTRVWAEPETGGEWYIPAAKSKRQRSTQVLAAAAEEFGYALAPQGGNDSATAQVVGGPSPSARQESVPTDLSDSTIEKLARTMTGYLRNQSRQGMS